VKLTAGLLLAIAAGTPEPLPFSEALANLKGIYAAERAYFDEVETYTEDATEIGFIPERGNRYAYYFNATGPRETRKEKALPRESHASIIGPDQSAFPRARFPASPQEAGCRITPAKSTSGQFISVGVSAKGKAGHFIVVALAVDSVDPERVDCWSISDLERTSSFGEPVSAGVPFHEQP
jgi:type IV pilus assembly protein PilA